MTFDIKFEHNGQPIEAEVEYTIADHGIGPYEFWGAHGNDSCLGVDDYWLNFGTWLNIDTRLTEQELIDVAEENEDLILNECNKDFEQCRYDSREPEE